MKVNFTLNGSRKTVDVPVQQTLMEWLQDQGLDAAKHGCETGDCGSCSVLVDGKALNSCLLFVAQLEGRHVETFESLAEDDSLGPLKEVLLDFAEPDCRFCVPGMLVSLKALLQQTPQPTETELQDALAGNLCRCKAANLPLSAIVEAVGKMGGKW